MKVCPVEEATVYWKVIRSAKVNVPTNINTHKYQQKDSWFPGQGHSWWASGCRTQWVHKQIVLRDSYKNEHKKIIPSTKAGPHLQACRGSWHRVSHLGHKDAV